ncbi:MAG: C39 family peptidase [Anaerolineales bacterium]
MAKRLLGLSLVMVSLLCLASIVIYNLPPFHESLSWRLANLRTQVRRMVNPPEQVVFVPQEQIDTVVQSTLQAMTPSPAATSTPDDGIFATATEFMASATPAASPTMTPSPTPIPEQFLLTGIRHEYQKFNNCGPANLSMALSFWGWAGNQNDTGGYLRHSEFDKNVMPGEMRSFVQETTEFEALTRVGGDLQLIKNLLAAGFPVVIEKGYDPPDDDWMGHYLTLNGYDDTLKKFTAQDSLIMPDYPLPYEQVEQLWRDFNHVYLVIYPVDRQAEVASILGPQFDKIPNFESAAQKARRETEQLAGRDLYFAWFNLGSNLLALEDYAGAAAAYDQAFAVYPTIQEDERPWRVMWYQDGPYAAYYHMERYQDIINLANTTFFALGEYTLEESFYWRGMAKQALDDYNGAVFDLKKAVELNPNYTPALSALEDLGVGTN